TQKEIQSGPTSGAEEKQSKADPTTPSDVGAWSFSDNCKLQSSLFIATGPRAHQVTTEDHPMQHSPREVQNEAIATLFYNRSTLSKCFRYGFKYAREAAILNASRHWGEVSARKREEAAGTEEEAA
ncbi:MAG: hypothetical protein Q9180_008731, partial [Flavoplaca navasiana]